jgi:uncharacterized protein YjbI with pentapeptide repeats
LKDVNLKNVNLKNVNLKNVNWEDVNWGTGKSTEKLLIQNLNFKTYVNVNVDVEFFT